MTDEIVGIDLGTTNSEIAIYRNGRPDVLADERGRIILPSVVGLSETGELLVGEEARHQGKRILVYDLGGGTFDVSVVRIEAGVVEVISSHGNNHLGGDDFDHKLVEHVLEHLKLKHGADVSDQPRAMARILRSSEAAKKQLSDHPYARIAEEYLAEQDGK